MVSPLFAATYTERRQRVLWIVYGIPDCALTAHPNVLSDLLHGVDLVSFDRAEVVVLSHDNPACHVQVVGACRHRSCFGVVLKQEDVCVQL